MANPLRGYVDMDVDGNNYKLKFDYNAIAELEQKLGYPVTTATQDQLTSIAFLRASLWAALQHDVRFVKWGLKQAGALMEKAGVEAAATAIMRAFALFNGIDPDKPQKAEAPADPLASNQS